PAECALVVNSGRSCAQFGIFPISVESTLRLDGRCTNAMVSHQLNSWRSKMTTGKTILITGASSGFGRLTAETLSKSEHKVFAGFRSTDGAKKQVADELRGKDIEILKLDVTDQGSVDSAIAELLEKSNHELDLVDTKDGMA